MSAHSPAPWTAEPTYYTDGAGERTLSGHYVVAADGTPVCRIDGTDATSAADLAAILAAPKLRDALREMVDRFESADEEPAYVTRARAALAPQTGGDR